MSRQGQCIITGCRLVIPEHNRSVWGDLHKVEDVYVFNHNGCLWEMAIPPIYDKAITIGEGAFYYEVNNVVIFPTRFGRLNEAALQYLHV